MLRSTSVAQPWAISGVDLHLDLSGARKRAALEAALREAVRTGRLRPGTRLPSSRSLAGDLGIARNTVADAYSQLVAEGWLTGRQGSGTRVAERVAASGAPVSSSEASTRRARYDLRPGSPDLSAFPRSAWLAAGRRALNRAGYEALGYADPRGRLELRHALAGYLARSRGVQVTADSILICSGFTQGFGLLCEVLKARGAARLAVEAFSLPGIREIAAAHHLGLQPLHVDSQGAATDALADADAALLTPAHQFPLGVPLGAQRRAQVVAWARQSGGLVIEDDYDGEFRYDRHPLGSLQALAPEHVVYAGTASKSLAPGLRLAWFVLPAHLRADMTAAKRRADRQTSAPDQLTLAELITSGAYDRHIRRSRLNYRRRRDHLVAALRRHAPHVQPTGIAAGLHALLALPPDRQEDDIVRQAADKGLALEGLHAYALAPERHTPALVVGYATPPEHAYTAAVARLCATLSAAPDSG